MRIFGQKLKTIQKHPKKGPETQKNFFNAFPLFQGFCTIKPISAYSLVESRVAQLDFF